MLGSWVRESMRAVPLGWTISCWPYLRQLKYQIEWGEESVLYSSSVTSNFPFFRCVTYLRLVSFTLCKMSVQRCLNKIQFEGKHVSQSPVCHGGQMHCIRSLLDEAWKSRVPSEFFSYFTAPPCFIYTNNILWGNWRGRKWLQKTNKQKNNNTVSFLICQKIPEFLSVCSVPAGSWFLFHSACFVAKEAWFGIRENLSNSNGGKTLRQGIKGTFMHVHERLF